MSKSLREFPVGILVSARVSRRRRTRPSLDDYPPLKKEVSLPLRVGLGAAILLSLMVITASAYSVLWANPAVRGPVAEVARTLVPMLQGAPKHSEPLATEPLQAATRTHDPAHPAQRPDEDSLTTMLRQAGMKPQAPVADSMPACSNLGTQVNFLLHPPEAFRQAAQGNKLVLMVHISGNFEEQGFT